MRKWLKPQSGNHFPPAKERNINLKGVGATPAYTTICSHTVDADWMNIVVAMRWRIHSLLSLEETPWPQPLQCSGQSHMLVDPPLFPLTNFHWLPLRKLPANQTRPRFVIGDLRNRRPALNKQVSLYFLCLCSCSLPFSLTVRLSPICGRHLGVFRSVRKPNLSSPFLSTGKLVDSCSVWMPFM